MANHTFKSGIDRGQSSFLPPRLDDYVGRDNPVRAIEAYVSSLDLVGLGFRHADKEAGGRGQPSFDPADLLKLYIYGYMNRVRSSRRLEREAHCNVEVMWLLKRLTPGYHTIADFRKDNRKALKAANLQFVTLVRALGLLGGEAVGIDGAFFHGDASKGSIVTDKRLEEQRKDVEREIEAYDAALDANDAEDAVAQPDLFAGEDVAGKLTALLEKKAEIEADQARLKESGETQLSRTDCDARLLSKRGQVVAGYNVQIAVDDKHKLIVASEVVNDGNDSGQLHAVALAAKEVLGVETLTIAADAGYYNGETLRACEADGIVAYVPEANKNNRLAKQGRFTLHDFTYDVAQDVYHCPAGAELHPMKGYKRDVGGKLHTRYAARKSVCSVCPLRSRCLTDKARRREIHRWQHQDVIDRHRVRMAQPEASDMMRRRAALAEHPFGTLKCRAGYRHFLVRGFDKVRGEWSLMALCYNFFRVLSIIGVHRFLAILAKNGHFLANLLLTALLAIAGTLTTILGRTSVKLAKTMPSSA